MTQNFIIFDLDDTLADLHQKTYRLLAEQNNLVIPSIEKMNFYSMEKSMPGLTKQMITDVFNTPGLFQNLVPYEGMVDALTEIKNRIIRLGNVEAAICTKPVFSNSTCVKDKTEWTYDVLGDWWGKRLIFTNDKTTVAASLLVDEKPDIEGLLAPSWKQLLYTQSYNKHRTDLPSFNNWAEWENTIIKDYLI